MVTDGESQATLKRDLGMLAQTHCQVDGRLGDLIVDRQGRCAVFGSNITIQVHRGACADQYQTSHEQSKHRPFPVKDTLAPVSVVMATVLLKYLSKLSFSPKSVCAPSFIDCHVPWYSSLVAASEDWVNVSSMVTLT